MEVNRLLDTDFICEIKESTWVANPVLVPKKATGILRMCVDFTFLNKHCLKDHFPLPRIDHIIDSTTVCERLYFLDAYLGYHQIQYSPGVPQHARSSLGIHRALTQCVTRCKTNQAVDVLTVGAKG